MRKNYFELDKMAGMLILLLFITVKLQGQISTFTYNYTGSLQSFTVPSCVTSISLDVKGAQGGSSADAATPGGLGGSAFGVITVNSGDVLNIYVGGTNGYNGGGAAGVNSGCSTANGGVGGGASDIRLNGLALANRVIVGAGGGGGGGNRISACGRGAGGGGGGGYYGGGGGSGYPAGTPAVATGGTQSAGGTGGVSSFSAGQNGQPGVLGIGGAGGGETGSNQAGANSALAGGVGGGLVGASGQQPATNIFTGQSGAGGSSYIAASLSNSATASGVRTGNGIVVISYNIGGGIISAIPSNTTICIGSNLDINTSGIVNSYTWSTGSNNSSITVSPTSNTVYVVSATNSINCISTASINVTVNPGTPTLAVVSSTNQTCLGKSATLTASGAITYTWSNGVTNGVSFNPTVTNVYTVTGQNACGTATATTAITIAPLPMSLAVTPTVVCAGSPALITAVAAATNYTWLPINASGSSSSLVVAPLVNTTYTVSATDGTCQGVATISLATSPVPTIGVSSTGTNVCEGEALSLSATGGINYTWTPGNLSGQSVTVNPTAPTAYIVTGDNSFGCTANNSTFVVTVPNPTPFISTNANLICAGESITLTATGANSYNWSGGGTGTLTTETPATTGVITVTGAVGSCTGVASIQIDVFTPPVTITAPSTLCSGNAANLTANGAMGYTWNPGGVVSSVLAISPTVTSTYTVSTQTPSGSIVCFSDKTVQVNVLPNPLVTAVADRTTICKNETTTLTAGGASTYNWIGISAGSSVVITSSLITVINYTVVGTAANGCTAEAVTQVKINSCTGLNEMNNQTTGIKLYPNPNSGEFTLEAESRLELSVVNQLGQVVKTIQLNETNYFRTQVSGLSNGVYFIKDKTTGKTISQKIMVNN